MADSSVHAMIVMLQLAVVSDIECSITNGWVEQMTNDVGRDDAETEEIAAFKSEVRRFFIDMGVEQRLDAPGRRPNDSDVSLWEEPDPEAERIELIEARAFRAKLFDARLAWIDGPVEFGGRGLSSAHRRAYLEVEKEFAAPPAHFFKLDRVISPILRRYATPELAEQMVPALFRGDVVACELFSEPGAGSDLASLATRAMRDGDDWVVDGQKVWTSDAQLADVGLLLCRTDPAVPGRAGISAFLIDMHSPGVEVRPLRQMTGGSSFNEVFLTDVRVPDARRLGALGEGWAVAMNTLRIERAAIGAGMGRGGLGIADGSRLMDLLRAVDGTDDPVLRQQLAGVYAGFQTARAMARIAQANPAGPLNGQAVPMLAKLALSRNVRAASRLAVAALGSMLTADIGPAPTFAWNDFVLGEPGIHIVAGTDEIVRNNIARHVLHLGTDGRQAHA
jgi:alkylation response protein AidB-like acyl-CoA dehydrogenase